MMKSRNAGVGLQNKGSQTQSREEDQDPGGVRAVYSLMAEIVRFLAWKCYYDIDFVWI